MSSGGNKSINGNSSRNDRDRGSHCSPLLATCVLQQGLDNVAKHMLLTMKRNENQDPGHLELFPFMD